MPRNIFWFFIVGFWFLSLKCIVRGQQRPLDELQTNFAINCKHFDRESYTGKSSPCRNRCLAIDKGWFNSEKNDWNRDRIVEDLGADVYNYCRFELNRLSSFSCLFADKGWKCLTESESNIERSLKVFRECTDRLNATEEQFKGYLHLPEEETIPCLFKCIADEMQLYNEKNEFIMENWRNAFGPTKNESLVSHLCHSNHTAIANQSTCKWMYNDYKCYEFHNYYK